MSEAGHGALACHGTTCSVTDRVASSGFSSMRDDADSTVRGSDRRAEVVEHARRTLAPDVRIVAGVMPRGGARASSRSRSRPGQRGCPASSEAAAARCDPAGLLVTRITRRRLIAPPRRSRHHLGLTPQPAQKSLDFRVENRVARSSTTQYDGACVPKEERHGNHGQIPDARRKRGLAGFRHLRHELSLGVRGRPRLASEALREGQAEAVGRQHPHRLVAGPRPGEPRSSCPTSRSRSSAPTSSSVSRRRRRRERPPPLPVVAAVAVPARRAGRADLHRQDRAAGAEHGRQVLRRDAGDRRGAPRRGVLAAPARQVRAGLPDHAAR